MEKEPLMMIKTTGISLSTLLHSVLFNDSYTPQGYSQCKARLTVAILRTRYVVYSATDDVHSHGCFR